VKTCEAIFLAVLPNEPVDKSEMTVQLFASIPVGDRISTLARLNALMHPGPTSQETFCDPLGADRASTARGRPLKRKLLLAITLACP